MSQKNSSTIKYDVSGIWKKIIEHNHYIIHGIPEISTRSFVTTQLMRNTPQGKRVSAILYMVKNSVELKKAELLLQYWRNIFHHNFDIITFRPDQPQWLFPLLNKNPFILIISPEQLEQSINYDVENKNESIITLSVNTEIKIIKLRKNFIDNGFLENTYVDETGTFATRGSIIDVWPHGVDNPIRIDVNNNAIESIFSFSRDGKKIKDIEKIKFPKTSNSHSPFHHWLSKFDIAFLDIDPITLTQWKNYKRHWTALSLHFNIIPDENQPIDFTLLPQNISDKNIEKKITDLQPEIIFASSAKTFAKVESIQKNIISAPKFLYAQNWYSKKLKTLFLLAGTNKKKTASGSKKQALFTKSIKQGDYLVHQDHGIGRFTGLVTQEIDGISHEYLLMTYAGGDKLYIPPYQINKLSKYIGESKPKINKLSGTTWPATIKKIREETIHLAHEIIELSARRQLVSIKPYKNHPEEKNLGKSFHFQLTQDQKTAWEDIQHDLTSGKPMDRLLCGDVAFGKTELAMRTAYKAVLNNAQVAILAPTTILVQQHYDNFYKRLKNLGVNIGLLSRWQDNSSATKTLKKLKTGEIDIIIGTHRLLSRDVKFKNLELLIIDEEQKFGVKDKNKLRKQRPLLHSLTMSATPIPRTLNYSLSGIRDISLIQTPPPGRLPITTHIKPHDNITIKEALTQELKRGGQTYYLVKKIKEIPGIVASIEKLVPKAKIAIAHGQLPPKNLASVMSNFDNGKIDILVTSTIIENGLDVANANTLIVDNAAHFGLSQLYQLRGRIGRGKRQGYAYLLFQRQKLTGIAEKRLQALQDAYELGAGFDIAVRDLEIRGAGNLLGKEQHGQIAAIGLALYTQLLEESVNHTQTSTDTKTQHSRIDTTIDLPIPSTLENDKYLSTAARLDVYQKLSWAQTTTELEQIANELLPTPRSLEAKNMILILKLKLLAGQAGIYSIDAYIKSRQPFQAIIKMHLVPDHNKQGIQNLLKNNDEWIYDGSMLKISTSYLGNDWLAGLIDDVKKIS